MTTSSKYWLLQWLDDHDIRSVEQAHTLLDHKRELVKFRESAAGWESFAQQPVNGTAVLAGAGLDLFGGLSCPTLSCQRLAVDKLFRHVWHYFDRIILNDNLTHAVAHHWAEDSDFHKRVFRRIEVLLYLREIGAESLIDFRRKTRPKDWRAAFKRANLSRLTDAHDHELATFLRRASVQIESKPDQQTFAVVDISENEIRTRWPVPDTESSAEHIRTFAVTNVYDCYSSYLAADVLAARRLRTPLGSSFSVHRRILAQSREIERDAVAFDLDLPILDDVPISTLLRIRREEKEHFRRFQSRLRLAIDERSKTSAGARSERIASEIVADVIEPELRNIRDRLAASQKLMTRKAGVGGFLATLTTTCGLLLGADPSMALSAGIAVVAPTVFAAASKHLEERRDIELEDMYFLWKAVGHAEKQH